MSEHSFAPNPYAPPFADAARPEAAPKSERTPGVRAFQLLGASVALVVVNALIADVVGSRDLTRAGFVAAALVAVAGFVHGVVSLARAVRSTRQVSPGFAFTVVLGTLANGFMTFAGALLALLTTASFSRGRQIRRFGRVLLPRVTPGGAWAELPISAEAGEPVRRALAAQWRENGRTEHASVAAFARLTLDLMALGAPPGLIAAANKDALDEIRHAELCFSLARALDGAREGPAAFPEAQRARTLPSNRTLALAALAVDSLVDGALHEGVSARVIAKLAKRCEEPRIRGILKEIAADEGRHAAHGWDAVAWCVAEGGDPVRDALRGAVTALPRQARAPLPEAAEGGAWERFGIHGRALEAEELASTRADLERRVARLVGTRRSEAA